MVQKKHTPTIDLVSVRNNMEQLKEYTITLGLPKTFVRRIDDALLVIEMIEKKKTKEKP